MRRLPSIAVFAVLHLVLSLTSLFVGGSFIMAAFDGKGSVLLATAASIIIRVLFFPMRVLSGLIPGVRGGGTLVEYAILLVNSLIWGAAASSVWVWWRRRRVAAVGA